jgi:hypothetical protein
MRNVKSDTVLCKITGFGRTKVLNLSALLPKCEIFNSYLVGWLVSYIKVKN